MVYNEEKAILEWLETNAKDYEVALDLAADCASVFEYWEEDWSIPEPIMRIALRLIPDVEDEVNQ